MGFSFSVLASGSRGNCAYVDAGDVRLLIDCGISTRQIEQRLCSIGVDPRSLTHVILTHEHSDHIRGLKVFAKKYPVDFFGSSGTFENTPEVEMIDSSRLIEFAAGGSVSIGGVKILTARTSHDAAEPVALRIETSNGSLGFITDLGEVTCSIQSLATQVDALVLEANHCPDLLRDAPYPFYVKERIYGSKGHLSNLQASQFLESLLKENSNSFPRTVVAAHISENSNTKQLAQEALQRVLERYNCSTDCFAARPQEPSPLLPIGSLTEAGPLLVNN